jgi:hypothetical protein
MYTNICRISLNNTRMPFVLSKIRLILEPNPNGQGQQPANYLVLKSALSTKIPLTTPSALQSGLKVLGPIVIKPGIINAVMIDFDPNTAKVAMGNGDYILIRRRISQYS